MIHLTKQQARNFLINRSFIVDKAPNLDTVLRYFRCIQVDPIATYGRTHELSMWNRVEGFKRNDLNEALYKKRTAFEYWLQLYSIIHVDYYPYIRHAMDKKHKSWKIIYYNEHKKQIKEVLEFLSKNDAVSAKDLLHITPGKSILDWKGKESQKAFLEYLWDTGEVMISERKSNHKLYDLTSDILSKEVLDQKVSLKESLKFHLESSFYYIGLLRRPFISRHRTFLIAEIRQLFAEYLKDGKIIQVEVEDSKEKYFILKDHLPELEKYKDQDLHKDLTILPPLDPLILDRDMTDDLFGFFYRWEAYTPPNKRLYGYYNMPILFEGNIIGQVQLDWKGKKLKLLKFYPNGKNTELRMKNEGKEIKKLLANKIAELEKFLIY